jgi:hypothetical protein
MKRAARHFGERLGNALYIKGNGIRTAPRSNRDALAELERKDSLNLFGNQAALRSKSNNDPSSCTVEEKIVANTTAVSNCNDAIRTAAAATMTPAAAVGAHTIAGTQHSFAHHSNNNNSNNNANRSSVHSGRPIPPPAPSPIVSRGPLQQQHQPHSQGIGNAHDNTFGSNQNNNYHQQQQHKQQQQQQQTSSAMAPPPRPIYNPAINAGTGTTAYQLLNQQQQQVSANINNTTANDAMKRGLNSGGDDGNIKRQKLNPYNNNNNISRLSV